MRPVVSGVALTHKRFAVAPGATAVVARRRGRGRGGAPKGTTFTFRLSERSTVLLAIDRLAAGRKAGGRCRKPARANRRGRRCTLAVRVGTLTRRNLPAGRASIAFSGRLGSRKLARGSYRAAVVASDAAGNASSPKTVGFAVVRG